jgi:hypothetical protein
VITTIEAELDREGSVSSIEDTANEITIGDHGDALRDRHA